MAQNISELVDPDDGLNIYRGLTAEDLQNLITSQEMYETFRERSTCNEVVGRIINIADIIDVNTAEGTKKVLNFKLEISNGIVLDMEIWQDEIARLKPYLIYNDVLHIESFYISQIKNDSQNKKKMKIYCQDSTEIHNLSKLNPTIDALDFDSIPMYGNIQECINKCSNNGQLVGLHACLIRQFQQIPPTYNFVQGIIFDNKYVELKVIIRSSLDVKYDLGQVMKMYGQIKENDKSVWLEIEKPNHIIILENQVVSPKRFPKDLNTPKKRIKSENTVNPAIKNKVKKRMKYE